MANVNLALESMENTLVRVCIRHRAVVDKPLMVRYKWCLDKGLAAVENPRRIMPLLGYVQDANKAELYPCTMSDGGLGCIVVVSNKLKDGSVGQLLSISESLETISNKGLIASPKITLHG